MGGQIRNTCSPFSQKRTDRKIGPIQRGPFVPKEIKTEPVVPFLLLTRIGTQILQKEPVVPFQLITRIGTSCSQLLQEEPVVPFRLNK